MLKFSGVVRIAALALVATPSVAPAQAAAQQQTIENDLSKCNGSAGSSVLVEVAGFEAATGMIRVQSYPATRSAWLAKGAWISRINVPVRPESGKMRFCLPVPAPGRYGIAVRHDLNGNGKTDLSQDGGGFSNNPSISIFNLGKPPVDKAAINVGNGVTAITIKLRYM